MSQPSKTGPRAVLASGLLLGAAMLAVLLTDRSHMLAANFEVYHVAAEAALAGEDFYAVAPDRFPDFYYLYPPITIGPFLPFAFVGLWVGFAIHTVLEIGVGLALAWVIVGWIERFRPLETVDRALIAGFVVGSIHTVPSLVYGQVNLRMALLLALGLALLERAAGSPDGGDAAESDDTSDATGTASRTASLAGVALGGAALLKVFPAAIGLWLLRVRAWRAVAAAVVTGLGGLALGAVAFGLERTHTFVFEALLPRNDGEAFVGGLDPAASYVTVRRPLSILLPDLDPALLTLLAALVLLGPLAYVYRRIETPTDRLVGAHATVLAIFVFFPSFPLYYVLTFGTLLPTLYLVRERLARRLLVAGALLANLAMTGGTLADVAAVLPPGIGQPLLAVGLPILTVATPMLVGCLVMLAGCVRYQYARRGESADAGSPTATESGEPY